MKSLLSFVIVVLAVTLGDCIGNEHSKVACFWNSTSFEREGAGKCQKDDLKPAVGLCSYFIYGFAGIHPTSYEVMSLNPQIDTVNGYGYYRHISQMKEGYPDFKVFLSIGGNADHEEDGAHKYLTLTETPEARNKFTDSVVRMLNDYGFDGVDLAWQFPLVKVKKEHGTAHKIWKGVKNLFGAGSFKDDKIDDHRNGFTNLVRELRTKLLPRNKGLTLSILPHVNVSAYYDPRLLAPNIDAVHVLAFDQKTPERNRKDADYPAPVFYNANRVLEDNLDTAVRYWLERGTPGSKILAGIPAFARTWKLTSSTTLTAVPPVEADGPGDEGTLTKTPGLLSYPEVCSRLLQSSTDRLSHVEDPTRKFGPYAYRLYNTETGADGVWVGYEDPDTAGAKASYAKAKGLGGVAIFDLSTDDFRGSCSGVSFPIVRAAKYKL